MQCLIQYLEKFTVQTIQGVNQCLFLHPEPEWFGAHGMHAVKIC